MCWNLCNCQSKILAILFTHILFRGCFKYFNMGYERGKKWMTGVSRCSRSDHSGKSDHSELGLMETTEGNL